MVRIYIFMQHGTIVYTSSREQFSNMLEKAVDGAQGFKYMGYIDSDNGTLTSGGPAIEPAVGSNTPTV